MRSHRLAALPAAWWSLVSGVVLCGLVGSWSGVAEAAPKPEGLRGVVVGPDGQPQAMVDVMLLPGARRLPSFVIRPKAFGLPLPRVQVARTDERGRFVFPRVPEGRCTLAIGQEGLLLFGTVATRTVDARSPVRVELREEEVARFADLAERAERATEVLEDILVELDSALGWWIEARARFEDAAGAVQGWLGCAEAEDDAEAAEVPAGGRTERARALLERLRRRLEERWARPAR